MSIGAVQSRDVLPARRWALVAGGVLLAAAVVLRFADLSGPSLWFDEGGSLRATNQTSLHAMLSDLVQTAHGDRFQPLYFILLWFWRQIAGDSAFSLRLPSALLGIAAVVVLVAGARELYGVRGAVWSLLFVAPSALLIQHAQEARPYALLIFLTALQTVLLLGLLEGATWRSRRSWAFWLVTGVASFASILTILFSLGLAAGDLVVCRRPRRFLSRWLPAALASLPAVLFFLASNVSTAPSDAQVTKLGGSVVRNAVFAVYGTLVGTTYGPPIQRLQDQPGLRTVLHYWPALAVFVVVFAALAALVAAALRRGRMAPAQRRRAHVLLVALVCSYILMIGFTVATKLNWQPRHSYFLVIPVALLLPLLVVAWDGGGAAARRWRTIAVASLVALAVLNLYSLSHHFFDRAYALDDYRDAAHYIATGTGPNHPGVLLFGVQELLEYYGATNLVDGRGLDQSELAQGVASATHDAHSVMLVIDRQSTYWKQSESVAAAMAPDYRLTTVATFPYFTIYTFDRAAGATKASP